MWILALAVIQTLAMRFVFNLFGSQLPDYYWAIMCALWFVQGLIEQSREETRKAAAQAAYDASPEGQRAAAEFRYWCAESAYWSKAVAEREAETAAKNSADNVLDEHGRTRAERLAAYALNA